MVWNLRSEESLPNYVCNDAYNIYNGRYKLYFKMLL